MIQRLQDWLVFHFTNVESFCLRLAAIGKDY